MVDSIRETLEAAYDGASSSEATRPEPQTGGSSPDTPEPVRDTSTPERQETVVEGGEQGGLQAEEEKEVSGERVRGPDGKFVKKDAAPATTPVETPTPPQEPTQPAVQAAKPPVSWKPAVREKWNTLPPEVQEEVLRRETEIQRGLSQAANARKFTEEFFRVVNPYESLIRAQNSTPLQAVNNLMNTAARLTLGTPAQKAQVIAEIIGNYGVDIETLDSVLAGQAPPDGEDKIARLIDQRLAPVNQLLANVTQAQQKRQQQLTEQIDNDIESFAKSADFFDDVRNDMADIMEFAARRNQVMSLQDAYDRAVAMNPEISKIVAQRKAAQQPGVVTEKARAAASSVRGSPPSVGAKPTPDDRRTALEQAWEQAGGR